MTAEDWTLDDPRAVTGYAPAYARSMHDVPSQVALFRRGDSTLVVGAWDARRDTTLLGRKVVAAVAYSLTRLESMAMAAGLRIERVLPGLWAEGPGWATNEQDLLVLAPATGHVTLAQGRPADARTFGPGVP